MLHFRKFHIYDGQCDSCMSKFKYRALYTNNVQRVEREYNGFVVEVCTGLNSWNSHNLCPKCIIKILQSSNAIPSIVNTNNYKCVNTTVYFHPHEYLVRVLKGGLS